MSTSKVIFHPFYSSVNESQVTRDIRIEWDKEERGLIWLYVPKTRALCGAFWSPMAAPGMKKNMLRMYVWNIQS